LAALSITAVVVLVKDKARRQVILSDRLVWLGLALTLVVLLWGAAGYVGGEVRARAVLQGIVLDARLPVILLAAYVVAPYALSARRWRWLLGPASLVVLFGILQTFVLPADVLRHFGYGPDTVPAVTLVDQKADFPRVQSTQRGPNPLGAYLVIIVTAGLVSLMTLKRRGQSALLTLAGGIVLIYTYSRSAYLGAAIAGLIAGWLMLARYRRWLIAGLISLLVLFGLSLFLLRDNDRFQNIFFHTDETSQSARSSNEDRLSALQDGLAEVASQPLGNGVGAAGPASVHNQPDVRISENYYMQLGQETGWLGLGLFLVLTGLIGYRLCLRRTVPWAIVLLASGLGLIVVNCLSHAWTDPTLAYVWWLLAGLTLGSAILPAESHNKHVKIKKTHQTD
jgi:hypothetical protein